MGEQLAALQGFWAGLDEASRQSPTGRLLAGLLDVTAGLVARVDGLGGVVMGLQTYVSSLDDDLGELEARTSSGSSRRGPEEPEHGGAAGHQRDGASPVGQGDSEGRNGESRPEVAGHVSPLP